MPKLLAFVAAALVPATATFAFTLQQSSLNTSDPVHMYTELAPPAAGAGYGIATDTLPLPFGDFFNDADVMLLEDVAVGAIASDATLAIRARAGGANPHTFLVEFLAPNTSTVLATDTLARFRQTGWQNNPYQYVPVTAAVPAGTYDVRVTNLGGGGHMGGLGVYDTGRVLTPGLHVVQAENYTWANGGKTAITDAPFSSGSFLDNQITGVDGGNWIDFDLMNAEASQTMSLSVSYRRGSPDATTLYVLGVDLDGDLSILTSLGLPTTGGWGGTAFVDSSLSGTFSLPAGFSALRLYTDGPIHLDAFTLNVIPEPSTYAGIAGALALGLVVLRRRSN